MEDCDICLNHGGIKAKIESLEKGAIIHEKMWSEIGKRLLRSQFTWIISALVSGVVILFSLTYHQQGEILDMVHGLKTDIAVIKSKIEKK